MDAVDNPSTRLNHGSSPPRCSSNGTILPDGKTICFSLFHFLN
eukprot:gene21347-8121_t